MKLLNKTTGIIEYSGDVDNFIGIDAYQYHDPDNPTSDNSIYEFEIIYTEAEERKYLQLKGVEFEGVMCSATGDDQAGLSAIFLQHSLAKMAGKTFTDVHFRFENGNRLTLNVDNIDALDAVWTPFRLSFFPPEDAA